MNLTRTEKKVWTDLKKGAEIITDSSVAGATIAPKEGQEWNISNKVFWNLVEKGVIYQQNKWPFYGKV